MNADTTSQTAVKKRQKKSVQKADRDAPPNALDPLPHASGEQLRISVDARGLALGILAALALLFALSWAEKFLVPLLLGIVIAYTLNPLVAGLQAIKFPRVVSTVLVMAGVTGALALGTYSLRGEVQTVIEQLPEAANKLATAITHLRIGDGGNLQEMQNAASAVGEAATEATSSSKTVRPFADDVGGGQPHVRGGHLLLEGLK